MTKQRPSPEGRCSFPFYQVEKCAERYAVVAAEPGEGAYRDVVFLGLDLADMDARVLVDGLLGNTLCRTQFPEPVCDLLQ